MRFLILLSAFLAISLTRFGDAIEKPLDWWQKSVFYQIYPRSFLDSDGDGVGDLQGIISKLSHLKETGISATWLSPIFKSPMVDAGYDISDFRSIHDEFGTMEDFETLIAEAKKLDIKIILDFVPNHSSDKHEWFIKSVNKTPGYEDYYIWRDGQNGNKDPPNNWLSAFGGSAWEFNEQRGQWYLHQFAIQQPDLNYRSSKVVNEMKEILRFWMEKGVAGFRCDAVPFLFEIEDFRDEPLSNDPNAEPTDSAYLNHLYTQNLPETLDMIYQWRAVLDEYSKEESRVMMTEAYADIVTTMKYYGNATVNGAHFTFNFLLITDLNEYSTAYQMANVINGWLSFMPLKYTANWVLGNHDQHRFGTRYGSKSIDGLNMMQMMLPGIGVTYNGDEWGQEDGFVSWEDTQDPQALNAGKDRYLLFTRDPERTPLQWDDTKNAGFSTANKTWLPVSDKYLETNLAKQKAASQSHYSVYKDMLKLRSEPAVRYGEIRVKAFSDSSLALTREMLHEKGYVFVSNRGDQEDTLNLEPFLTIPESATVVVTSTGATFKKGDKVDTRKVVLKPYEAYVLTY